MGHGWARNLAVKYTERRSIRSVMNTAVFTALRMLNLIRTAIDSVLSEVIRKMEQVRNLSRKGILSEKVRTLWKNHVADYCMGFPRCFDCNRTNCEWCHILRENHSNDSRRGFLRLVKSEPRTPHRTMQVRYYKGFGVIDGGKELLPGKRKNLKSFLKK